MFFLLTDLMNVPECYIAGRAAVEKKGSASADSVAVQDAATDDGGVGEAFSLERTENQTFDVIAGAVHDFHAFSDLFIQRQRFDMKHVTLFLLAVLLFGCDKAATSGTNGDHGETESGADGSGQAEGSGTGADGGGESSAGGEGTAGNGEGTTGGDLDDPSVSYEVGIEGRPSERYSARAVAIDETRILIYGGSLGFISDTALEDGHIFDRSKKSWKSINSVNAPKYSSMYKLRSTTANGIVYFWGIKNADTAPTLAQTQLTAYDPVADTWKVIDHPLSDASHPGFLLSDGFYLFTNRQKRFNIASASWEDMSAPPWSILIKDHSVILCGGKILAWGGYSPISGSTVSAGVQAKGWLYHPSSDTWTEVSTDGAPSARTKHAATCVGDKFIIFGGQTNDKVSNSPPAALLGDGGIYDAVADSWAPIAGQADVSARSEAQVFGSQNKLIVAKGKCDLLADPIKYCDTFAVYDLSLKTWQSIVSSDKDMTSSLQFTGQSVAETGGYVFLFGGYKVGDIYSEKAFLFPVVP
jgi:hypothetical protein